MFGIIFQDFGKYAFSVRDNIAFGQISKEKNDDEIKSAAVQSSADEFIKALPLGYETPLMRYFDEDGTELSIGQWQKLSIARAFYSDSDFLILDEPTASLDPMAEQEIFNQFEKLRRGKTTIFVSHRLSSATIASKIIVVENGEIVEEGDHRTLMAKRGKYYELFSTQAKRYIMEESEIADADKMSDARSADPDIEKGHAPRPPKEENSSRPPMTPNHGEGRTPDFGASPEHGNERPPRPEGAPDHGEEMR